MGHPGPNGPPQPITGHCNRRNQGRPRPSHRQALPSSPVHSYAPDGPSVSAKTCGRAVALPQDFLTMASHTTDGNTRPTTPPNGQRRQLTMARPSSAWRAVNTHPGSGTVVGECAARHFAYYAVPGNDAAASFLYQVRRLWFRALRRRSQRHRLTWERMGRIATRWLPLARVMHPYPEVRFAATYPR